MNELTPTGESNIEPSKLIVYQLGSRLVRTEMNTGLNAERQKQMDDFDRRRAEMHKSMVENRDDQLFT